MKNKTKEELKTENEKDEVINEIVNDSWVDPCEDYGNDNSIPESLQILGILPVQSEASDVWM